MSEIITVGEVPIRPIDYSLDITGDVCPMTFVKTKLLIEKMKPLEIAEVRLNAGEPLDNVPRAVTELGHTVLALAVEDPAYPQGPYRLTVQKAG